MHRKKADTTLDIRSLQKVIISLLPTYHPSLIQAAEVMNMRPRTFQRRLKYTGKTYSQLLDETRQIEASKLLGHRELRVNQIAKLLGYADAGSFSRAFLRWNGISPRQYKNAAGKLN